MKRRSFLELFAAGLFPITGCSSIVEDRNPESLGKILKERALFGSAFDKEVLIDPYYAALIKRHCNILTTDWSLKFGSLRPNSGDARFDVADKLIEFANNAHIPVRGHTLVWNEWQPEWLKRLSAKEISYWMDRHVSELVERYAGRMHSWDVVNEPFWPDHNAPKGYRKGVWFNALGEGYVERALKIAASSDSTAKLCINEAYAEQSTLMANKVRGGLYSALENLLDRGVKVDAVGLQCHLRPDKNLNLNIVSDYIGKLSKLPVEVYITELDVRDGFAVKNDPKNIGVFSDKIYREFAKMALSHSNVKAIICWQLSDKYSWLKKEGVAVSPLPFNEDMKPNPAYFGLASEFAKAVVGG